MSLIMKTHFYFIAIKYHEYIKQMKKNKYFLLCFSFQVTSGRLYKMSNAGVSNMRPGGQVRPTSGSNLAREAIS